MGGNEDGVGKEFDGNNKLILDYYIAANNVFMAKKIRRVRRGMGRELQRENSCKDVQHVLAETLGNLTVQGTSLKKNLKVSFPRVDLESSLPFFTNGEPKSPKISQVKLKGVMCPAGACLPRRESRTTHGRLARLESQHSQLIKNHQDPAAEIEPQDGNWSALPHDRSTTDQLWVHKNEGCGNESRSSSQESAASAGGAEAARSGTAFWRFWRLAPIGRGLRKDGHCIVNPLSPRISKPTTGSEIDAYTSCRNPANSRRPPPPPSLSRKSISNLPNLRLLRILLPSEADLLAAVCRYPSIILSDL
ncbi:hypothetical protein KSP40_PGU009545 [Platanthera guangdongensis]|uniref:Uncharacterized protein n=1 Tax=Platanthera guangdongensis TaxID=2320717 RepID=A0ABR2LK42_9ASPA